MTDTMTSKERMQQAYEFGRAARFADPDGVIDNPSRCPFSHDSTLAWQWHKGYSDADTQIGEAHEQADELLKERNKSASN